MKIKGTLNCITNGCLIGFDAEWTKNYKIKNGNIPFCFSIITIDCQELTMDNLKNGNINFSYVQYYCEKKEEFKELVNMAETWFARILKVLDKCVLCGHQISSDFSVLYNIGTAYDINSLSHLERMRREWRTRKETPLIHIVDTRYDVTKDFLGKSRRLVDMCNDFNLDVTQPELKKSSMTKLQNTFIETGDEDIYERISVMNLRHSLCAVILYWLNEKINTPDQRIHININKSVYNCLKQDFKWVDSKDFLILLKG